MMDALSSLCLGTLPVADIPAGGGYLSTTKIIVMLVLIVPWLLVAPRVSKDAAALRVSKELWGGLVLASGGIGVLIWLLVSNFVAGLVVYILMVAASLVTYLLYRNSRIPADERKGALGLADMFKRKPKITAVPATKLRIYTHDSRNVQVSRSADNQEVETFNQVQDFLYDMLFRRASEVDVMPAGEQARIRFVIDGMLVEQEPLPLDEGEAIIQYLKPIAGMNAEDRRRPQKGKITVDMAQGPTDIVLTTAGTTGGQRLQLRIRHEIIRTRLSELGMSKDVMASVKAMCARPGLILVSGRSGSGVTSTLYSLLREHDAFTQQIVTFERQPAIELENITQNRYEGDDRLPAVLVSALRADPDVLMVDSCGDAKSAEMLAKAASHKAILLGIQASETFTALAKWVKLCGNAELAMSGLSGIVCQMLVRTLCPACREAYKPDPQMLAKANLSGDKEQVFYRTPTKPLLDEKGRPTTCLACQGNGYIGRTGVFELLEITDEIRQMVIGGTALAPLKSAARKNRMLYLQDQALAKVSEGLTSIQEVIRVSQPQTKK